jgi:hypothetical protein
MSAAGAELFAYDQQRIHGGGISLSQALDRYGSRQRTLPKRTQGTLARLAFRARAKSMPCRAEKMMRRGTIARISSWGRMRSPKKSHHASSKKQTKSLATRRPLPNRSTKRPQKQLQKRAVAQTAATPKISQQVQEQAAPADADVLSALRRSFDRSWLRAQFPYRHRRLTMAKTKQTERELLNNVVIFCHRAFLRRASARLQASARSRWSGLALCSAALSGRWARRKYSCAVGPPANLSQHTAICFAKI